MSELKGLIDKKKEYVNYLLDTVTDTFVQQFYDIYNENARKNAKVLQTFQDHIAGIPEWNHLKIAGFYERLKNESGCAFLPDLLREIFTMHVKIYLLTENMADKMKQVKLKVPNAEHFFHKCLVACARIAWKQPYLFYHGVRTLEQQHNRVNTEELFKKAILTTIRSCLPMDQLLALTMNQHGTARKPQENQSDASEAEESDTESEESEAESESEESESEESEAEDESNAEESESEESEAEELVSEAEESDAESEESEAEESEAEESEAEESEAEELVSEAEKSETAESGVQELASEEADNESEADAEESAPYPIYESEAASEAQAEAANEAEAVSEAEAQESDVEAEEKSVTDSVREIHNNMQNEIEEKQNIGIEIEEDVQSVDSDQQSVTRIIEDIPDPTRKSIDLMPNEKPRERLDRLEELQKVQHDVPSSDEDRRGRLSVDENKVIPMRTMLINKQKLHIPKKLQERQRERVTDAFF